MAYHYLFVQKVPRLERDEILMPGNMEAEVRLVVMDFLHYMESMGEFKIMT